MNPHSVMITVGRSQGAFQQSRYALKFDGMSGFAVTTTNNGKVVNPIDLIPRFSIAPDDYHLFGGRETPGAAPEFLLRLFAVEDTSKKLFKSGWIGVAPGSYVGERGIRPEQCLFGAFGNGYRLALIVANAGANATANADANFDSFCKEPVQIGFRRRGGVLHVAAALGNRLQGVAEFDAHEFVGSGSWLPAQDRLHAQGFMLNLVSAFTGYIVAARFVKMPRDFMHRLRRSIEHSVRTAPAAKQPRSKYCCAFYGSDPLGEALNALDDYQLVFGENCPVASLWIPAGTEFPA